MWRPRDPLEGRGEQINASDEGNMTVLRDRTSMSPERIRIAELAKEDKDRKFSSIAHLLTVTALEHAWLGLRKAASAGVDGVTMRTGELCRPLGPFRRFFKGSPRENSA